MAVFSSHIHKLCLDRFIFVKKNIFLFNSVIKQNFTTNVYIVNVSEEYNK